MDNLIHADCLVAMAAMEAESIDAIVTDPPYGLEFMGKEWDKLDGGLPQENVWKGRRGKGGSNVGTDDTKPSSRHHVSYGGKHNQFKRCSTCGKRQFSGSPCICPEPTWEIETAQAAPTSSIRMQRWHEAWAREAFRIAKPGAHLLAFGGTRTVHRLAAAIEDAGWEIRDMLVWGYASGFPKSHNLDGEWSGWGTALKPAWEPIVMARKPLRGTVAANVLRHGTGALNIDGTRIGPPMTADEIARSGRSTNGAIYGDLSSVDWKRNGRDGHWHNKRSPNSVYDGQASGGSDQRSPLGRWPANVILTDPIFDGGIDGVVGGGEARPSGEYVATIRGPRDGPASIPLDNGPQYGDSGTYSRFFLIPKSARAEREPVLGGLALEPMHLSGGRVVNTSKGDGSGIRENKPRANVHPTVKPLDLMRHLVRLVTPPGGVVLDPFLGSGTTALACEMEGFPWLGIEKEAEYVAIAEARLNGTQKGLGLVG